ncbi:MAG: hypothetical protein M3Q69_02495 [Acidobacteriota bacterium]|nr:hypothetical protein [Acidobacteriota bacterium]
MTSNEFRLVAAGGELLPAGQADADARKVFDFLRTASGISASFHALNHLELVLTDESIRSRWHAQAGKHHADLQREGLKWSTGVWPNATQVPQAFITISNRAGSYATRIGDALANGDTAIAVRLLDEWSGDLGKGADAVAKYRASMELVFGTAMLHIGALTLGPASIFAVMADDAVKIAELTAQIDAAKQRIEARVKEIADRLALNGASLAAFLIVLGHVEAEKPVKEWGKAFAFMMAAGTTPNLQSEAFIRDFDEIVDKMTRIARLGRDLFALVSIGSAIKSIGDASGGLALRPVEALFTAMRARVNAAASALRSEATKQTIAATRAEVAAITAWTQQVSELCQHFQEKAVEAQKPPAFLFAPTRHSSTTEQDQ